MSKLNRLLLPAILVAQALFLGSTFRTLAVAIIGLVVCSGAAFLTYRKQARQAKLHDNNQPTTAWEATRRARVILTMFVLAVMVAAWRFLFHVGDSFNPIAYAVDGSAHVCFVWSLAVLSMHPRYGHPSMLAMGMLVAMLCAAAGGAAQSIPAQVAVALVAGIGYLLASRLILNHWAIRRSTDFGSSNTSNQQPVYLAAGAKADGDLMSERRRIGFLFSLIAVSIFVISTSALAHATSLLLPEIQTAVFDKLKSTFDVVDESNAARVGRYVRGNRLGSIRNRNANNPEEVALECYSTNTPGYLRGNAFDTYYQATWEEVDTLSAALNPRFKSFRYRELSPSQLGVTPIRGPEDARLRRFEASPITGTAITTLEIKNDPMKGQVFFAPMDMQWIEAQGRVIEVNSHDIIEGGINAHYPYIIGVSSTSRSETLDAQKREVLTSVSFDISEELRQLSQQVVADSKTNREKAEAIRNHFSASYLYSMELPVPPRGTDPLMHFLRTKHAAHCEYFASATVLMLRSVGVPARYITGYVAMESSSEENDLWLARNRDAHAWAEAYDDETKTWFPVESTPGRTYLSVAMGDQEEQALSNDQELLEAYAAESDTFMGQISGWLLSMRATDPLTLLIRFGQIPMFLIAAFLLWRHLRREQHGGANPDDLLSRKLLSRVDRRIKKHALVRKPHETMHQFANRIESHTAESEGDEQKHDLMERYAAWYRSFAEARYQGQLPEPFQA